MFDRIVEFSSPRDEFFYKKKLIFKKILELLTKLLTFQINS